MGLFVKTDTITIDDTEVLVKEVGVDYLLLSDEEKTDTKRVLQMHTSLTIKEVDNLTIDAFQEILEVFYELNEKHFGMKDEHNEGDNSPK